MIPTRNAGAVGLRELIRADEVDEVFAILKSREVAVEGQTWNRRYREYMEKIKTGSVFEIAEVLRDLQRLKGDKELSFGERKMLDTARTLLIKEIAVATKSKEVKIEEKLDRIFPPDLILRRLARTTRPNLTPAGRDSAPGFFFCARAQLARGAGRSLLRPTTGLTKGGAHGRPTDSAQIDPQLTPAARKFLEETTMKSLLGIPDEALDAVMARRLPALSGGPLPGGRDPLPRPHRRRPQVLVVVLAATPRRCAASAGCARRSPSSSKGLVYEPDEPKLLFMRGELREAIAARGERTGRASVAHTRPARRGLDRSREENVMSFTWKRRLGRREGCHRSRRSWSSDVVNTVLPKNMDGRRRHRRRASSTSRPDTRCRRSATLDRGAQGPAAADAGAVGIEQRHRASRRLPEPPPPNRRRHRPRTRHQPPDYLLDAGPNSAVAQGGRPTIGNERSVDRRRHAHDRHADKPGQAPVLHRTDRVGAGPGPGHPREHARTRHDARRLPAARRRRDRRSRTAPPSPRDDPAGASPAPATPESTPAPAAPASTTPATLRQLRLAPTPQSPKVTCKDREDDRPSTTARARPSSSATGHRSASARGDTVARSPRRAAGEPATSARRPRDPAAPTTAPPPRHDRPRTSPATQRRSSPSAPDASSSRAALPAPRARAPLQRAAPRELLERAAEGPRRSDGDVADQFMKAVTSGKIPADVANNQSAMMQIQARMNQITQMNELVTTMMEAMHEMQMAIIQNIRV